MTQTGADAHEGEQIQEKRHNIWKKNAPYLYDVIMTKELAWPTLTLEWFPEKGYDADTECHVHQLLLGTNTSGQELNYLMNTHVLLPSHPTLLDMKRYDQDTKEVGEYARTNAKIVMKSEVDGDGKKEGDKVEMKLVHENEVNTARYCPQHAKLIATKPGQSSDVLLFDVDTHPFNPTHLERERGCKPNFRLKNHRQSGEGFALAWSHMTAGLIASSGSDGIIDLWDTTAKSTDCCILYPTVSLRGHEALIEDVAFHYHDPNLLASASDDKTTALWDLRKTEGCILQLKGHTDEVNCLSFTHFNDIVLATGSSDKSVAIWDLRRASEPVHRLCFHTDAVYKARFAPFNQTILATGGLDGKVLLWDLAKAGAAAAQTTAAKAPPADLLFIHTGHQSPITDLSWNLSNGAEWVIASASDNNLLHIWRMRDRLYRQWTGAEGPVSEGLQDETMQA
jgi:histone-binding protein RBBP4